MKEHVKETYIHFLTNDLHRGRRTCIIVDPCWWNQYLARGISYYDANPNGRSAYMEIKGKIKKTLVEIQPIDDVVCNKCGKSIQYGKEHPSYEGTRLYADFGYGSKYDGLVEEFDICDDCYDDIKSSFKHPPKEKQNLFGGTV